MKTVVRIFLFFCCVRVIGTSVLSAQTVYTGAGATLTSCICPTIGGVTFTNNKANFVQAVKP